MSGGELVVLDRNGRDVKRYSLPDGLATLGSDPACDICVMLASVSSHHATIVVHANQTIVRNVGDGDTLVNGAKVSVAALQHGDVITLGGRSLRWEYTNPPLKKNIQIQPAFLLNTGTGITGRRRRRAGRRVSATVGAGAVDRALQLAIEMSHRASMPASSGGKQVAVVQPQRRDNNSEQKGENVQSQPQSSKRSRNWNMYSPLTDEDRYKRKPVSRASPKTLQSTTKATLWIESRKTSPRKSTKQSPARSSIPVRVRTPASTSGIRYTRNKTTPLRMTVLKKAQSAQKQRVTKIEEPVKIDETKQAAIMLMTGHTAKNKLVTGKPKTPSYVVKKPSPARKTPRRPRISRELNSPASSTPRRVGSNARSAVSSARTAQNRSTFALETSVADTHNGTVSRRNTSRRSGQRSSRKSPSQLNPKKSALKDPKRLNRKTESIKFDLSNLQNNSQESSEVLTVNESTAPAANTDCNMSDEFTLRYSPSSSPSPRQPIHSRSSRILEKSIGVPMTLSPRHTVNLDSTSTRKSLRGSLIVQKALAKTVNNMSTDSNKSVSIPSAFKTHTLSPRPNTNMESYSIVDLVSIDSNESRPTSVYNSVTSDNNSSFGTPQNSTGRITRSSLDPTLLSSSTPYVSKTTTRPSSYSQNVTRYSRSRSNLEVSHQVNLTITNLTSTRRSKSLSTPDNTQKHVSVNSTRISRPSRSRSRLIDSDLMLIDETENDASPKSSKRMNRTSKSIQNESTVQKESFNYTNGGDTSSTYRGTTTPENRTSPQNVGTPVLRIQTLLGSSQNSSTNVGRSTKRKSTRNSTEPKKGSVGVRSNSMRTSTRKTKLDLTKNILSSNTSEESAARSDNEEVVTPKSAVKLIPEAVKNKHSTAKKPLSKRTIIDDLNQSDIVKQLFNSPVKRKLSQSMIEFSRKGLFEEDEDNTRAKRPTRNTIALISVACDDSVLDRTEAISPELFVSPIVTPRHSPDMTRIKRLFANTSPENNLDDVRGVKLLLRTPRPRRSVKNDLTNVSGVKLVFAKSPENRLSDVRIKNVFAKSPRNDLRRVTGVKTLFRRQKSEGPKNDLSDVRGVRELFRNSPKNDLRNISGVKRTLQRSSPRNDFTDVRGVRHIFRQEKETGECNVSGVEQLFDESRGDADTLFDRLVGKPRIKSVYSKTFSSRSTVKQRERTSKTLHSSIDEITNNVEEWLENELTKRANKDSLANISLRRELKKLATDTVEGSTPFRESRVRDSTVIKCTEGEERRSGLVYSARRLPIKKRSLADRSEECAMEGFRLPIKKRRVAHSTPVKNNLTVSVSELSRVSPIALGSPRLRPRQGVHCDTVHGLTVPPKEPSTRQAKTKRTKEKVTASNNEPDEVKVSPRKTRAKNKVTEKSPTTGSSRARTTNKHTLVINKKASPRTLKTTKAGVKKNIIDKPEGEPEVPNKISLRPKRNQIEVVKMTPKKNVRTRVQKASIIVTKPSPVLKPRSSKKVSIKESNVPEGSVTLQENNVKEKVTRSTVLSKSPTESQAPRRQTRALVKNVTKTKKTEARNNKSKGNQKGSSPKKSPKTANLVENEEAIKEKPAKTRKRNKSPESKVSTNKQLVEEKSMRTRTRRQPAAIEDTVRGDQKTNTNSKTTSGKIKTEAKGKKRKTIVQNPEPAEPTRGRGKTVKTTETKTLRGKQKALNVTDNVNDSVKRTRRVRFKGVSEERSPATNKKLKQVGKKTSAAAVAESEPQAKRKRTNNLKTSPVKESPKKQQQPKASRTTRRTIKGNDQTQVVKQRVLRRR